MCVYYLKQQRHPIRVSASTSERAHTHTHTHERASGGLCNYRKSKIEGRKRAEDRLLAFAFHDALPATLYNAASRE